MASRRTFKTELALNLGIVVVIGGSCSRVATHRRLQTTAPLRTNDLLIRNQQVAGSSPAVGF